MQIICLGLSHRTAPVELRERFAVPESTLGETALRLARVPGLGEAVIVSTCNRVEYYAAAEDAAAGFTALREFVSQAHPWPDSTHQYGHHTRETLRHLFRVVSGLDSMILGETEILGQVKKAYAAAQAQGATARHLNKFFQRAFSVAKEVRTRTNITRGAVSVGSVAVDLAEKIFRLEHCKVMILGAGETSELTAGALQARGVKSIFVSNRSWDRAVSLAERMNGKAVKFEDWASEFADVDILIGSTAAPHHIVTREKLAGLMRTRPDRPLLCIDLAVPRDFDPAVNGLEGVYLYDIDHLRKVAEESMAVRRQELVVCEGMIDRHVTEFAEWLDTSGQQALAYSTVVSGGTPEGSSLLMILPLSTIRLGTRASALAVAQVVLTQASLARRWPALATEVKKFTTRGDRKLDLSLVRESEAGGKGLFTKELEDELLSGEIDVAVHSLKDLPGHLPAGLELAAVLERAATGDLLIAKAPGGLSALPAGARVGTSSIRRARQLQWLRPDLQIEEWRGNVQTRLRKLGNAPEVAGIVLAQAGLERLGFAWREGLEFEEFRFAVSSLEEEMLPAIGQGAIALEARSDRPEVLAVLEGINHRETFLAVRAERELQRLLAGDCTLPVGVRTRIAGNSITLRAILFGAEGVPPREAAATVSVDEPEKAADEVARQLGVEG